MITTVVPSFASKPSLAGNVARHEKAHSEFFFDSYSDFTTSNEQITKQMPSESYVASTNCTSDFCCNQQYSVTAITTAAGAIAERYAYTAYGLPTILNASATTIASSAISNRYTYTGREWDATLGLHHFRARWMSPIAGRFLGRDPIGHVGSHMLYQHSGRTPMQMLDPFGLVDIGPGNNQMKINPHTAKTESECLEWYNREVATCYSWPWYDWTGRNECFRSANDWLQKCKERVTNGTPTTLLNYGNYCGPLRRASCDKNGQPDFIPQPKDDLDKACAFHDCCLRSAAKYLCQPYHKHCNLRFCAALIAVDCSKTADETTCIRYRDNALSLCMSTINNTIPLP
jgi:RHS repeat-associated protein